MNSNIIISVKDNINRFIKKCIEYKINIDEINYINEDEITCKIDIKDYKKIKRLNYYSKFKIIKYEGINGLKIHFKKYVYVYMLLLFCFIVMDILTSFIVKIDIIHENNTIRQLVKNELKNHGIEEYTLAYSFDELEKIKNDILKDNPNKLEWMSITRVGMSYIVRIEERIINEEKKEEKPRNIIASKDAYITKIIATSGETLVRSGDYVKKGDILISGNIYLYDEIKGRIPAKGAVYGDVWYESEVKVPYNKEVIHDTGKSRYNLNINNKILFKNKYKLFRQENIKEINVLGFKIKIYKEIEYNRKIIKLTEKELENEAFKKVNESFKEKLKDNGNVISQKVLKKRQNNSTIEYRIFVITNELISKYVYINEGDIGDTKESN